MTGYQEGDRVVVARANIRRHENMVGEVGTVTVIPGLEVGVAVELDKYPGASVFAAAELEKAS